MKNRKLLILFGMVVISKIGQANTISPDEGKTIFVSRCAACHNVNVKVVGPALSGVDQRHSVDWIVNFVHSSQSMVKKNDKQATQLFNEFNNTIMPDHADLSDGQIKNILAFIKTQEKNAAGNNTLVATPERMLPNYRPVAINNIGFFGPYVLLVFLLAASLLAAVKVKELQRANNDRRMENEDRSKS